MWLLDTKIWSGSAIGDRINTEDIGEEFLVEADIGWDIGEWFYEIGE